MSGWVLAGLVVVAVVVAWRAVAIWSLAVPLATEAWLVVAAIGGRLRLSEVQKSCGILEARHADLLERLDRGETFEVIADDYRRLYRIPRARTLLCAGELALDAVAQQPTRAARQARWEAITSGLSLAPLATPGEAIETFSFSDTVHLVRDRVRGWRQARHQRKASGVLVITTTYIYFFAEPESWARSFGERFVTEHLSDQAPYLGVRHGGYELTGEVAEMLPPRWSHESIGELKFRFADAASFAVPLRNVAALGLVRTGRLRPERLVIKADRGDGSTEGFQLTPRWSLRDRPADYWLEVIRAACVWQGVLIRR